MRQKDTPVTGKFPNVNYIGNKGRITDWIFENVPTDAKSFFDAFSGGCSVSYEAKKRGFTVITNDIMKINYYIAKSLIENKKVHLTENDLDIIFSGKSRKGYMHKNFSNVNFFPEECMQLDQYKKNIDKLKGSKKQLAFVLLRRAMIRKMPYSRFTIPWKKVKELRDEDFSYKHYGRKRAYHNQTIKEHFYENLTSYNNAVFDNGKKNKSYNKDIFTLLTKIKADVIYLDPPYAGTLNDYSAFYGMLDEFIESKKRKQFKNNFTKKEDAIVLFDRLFANLKNFKYGLLSYNNNSYPERNEMLKIIKPHVKSVKMVKKKMNYQITGKKQKNANYEYLFVIKTKA